MCTRFDRCGYSFISSAAPLCAAVARTTKVIAVREEDGAELGRCDHISLAEFKPVSAAVAPGPEEDWCFCTWVGVPSDARLVYSSKVSKQSATICLQHVAIVGVF